MDGDIFYHPLNADINFGIYGKFPYRGGNGL